ncbi:TetR/AcrR family transcriptional regulator [Micromonospora endophytica]|uniref:TetR family transcriptional regulator n=1 Tax=Micromonospora endophytica TaxID=515350 RepID=A0A2W2C9U4_9ACTN|nr:TetR/AcrR family transcriptional regulator [Micromonospora endophytica]PZF89604.1 TetR family transcriptional regulator [Micromonospora endophytica]RIW45458.1 TetR/AcrR family transcriptional regulator [Micromonospora endophytica]BCJ58605.1 TetR family transcriptional regulator [Micromonospora endophytica]
MSGTRGYHHGDLRRALIAAAVEVIEEAGPTALSLRDLARRAGVSHAAPAHHFGDRAGLFTVLAVQGFDLLAETLDAAGTDLLDLGVGYVTFAVRHRAYFEVMFHPDLYRADDPEVRAARARSGRALRSRVTALTDGGPDGQQADVMAAWSIVHGFATLWLAGAFPAGLGDDPGEAARAVIRRLFTPPPSA